MSQNDGDTVAHPVFGELRWETLRECWFTQVCDSEGGQVDVSVKPHEQDPLAVLDRATDLYRRAVRVERRILRAAVREELLELYNETWRVAGRELTAAELISQLRFEYIEISPVGVVPVILSYTAGDLFGGHTVDVEVDETLSYIDVDLVG